MTEDEWEKVTDKEVIDEFLERGLVSEADLVYADCVDEEIEAAIAEHVSHDPDFTADIRILCDIYKTNNKEALDKALSDMFYEVLGVIV